MESMKVKLKKNAHNGWVLSLDFNESILVTGGRDHSIKIWSRNMDTVYKTLNHHTSSVYCVKLFQQKLLTCSSDKTIAALNLDGITTNPENVEVLHTMNGHTAQVWQIDCNTEIVVSASDDSTVKVWSMATAKLQSTLSHSDQVYTVVLFNNFIISGANESIYIWNCSDTKLIKKFTAHDKGYRICRLSADATKIWSADNSGVVKLWNFQKLLDPKSSIDECKIVEMKINDQCIQAIQHDSRRVVTGSLDETVKITNLI